MEECSSEASVQDAQALSSDNKLDSLTRHEEFWFNDGSVVLVARNTGFRVFRSLLAAQSTVFADMLSSSSPSADEMVEGCPVVPLSDSPQDVAHFLGVLLPKSRRTYVLCLQIMHHEISRSLLKSCCTLGCLLATRASHSAGSQPSSASRTSITSRTSSIRPSSPSNSILPATSTPGRTAIAG